jgi:hypothetical protein
MTTKMSTSLTPSATEVMMMIHEDDHDDDHDDDELLVDPIEEAFENMKHPMEFMLMPQWRQWKFGV